MVVVVDRCGRLASASLGGTVFHLSCQLEHGHDGPHTADLEQGRPAGAEPGWRGSWIWTEQSPSDQGPSLADQILESAS